MGQTKRQTYLMRLPMPGLKPEKLGYSPEFSRSLFVLLEAVSVDSQAVNLTLTFPKQPDEEYLEKLVARMLQTIGDRRLYLNVYVAA